MNSLIHGTLFSTGTNWQGRLAVTSGLGPHWRSTRCSSFVVVTTYLTERELREERVTLVYSSGGIVYSREQDRKVWQDTMWLDKL